MGRYEMEIAKQRDALLLLLEKTIQLETNLYITITYVEGTIYSINYKTYEKAFNNEEYYQLQKIENLLQLCKIKYVTRNTNKEVHIFILESDIQLIISMLRLYKGML